MHVYLCVTIDCECDKGAGWRSQRPLAFTAVSDGIARRLHPLFTTYGAKPTYLLSPEVIRDASSAEVLRTLPGSYELGSHLHGEYAEPDAFEPEVTTVFQRDYPPEVEQAKLASLTSLFSAAFGRRPKSFRAGRFGIGSSSIELLEGLGYDVDSSVAPFVHRTGAGPLGLSLVGAPTQPYRPDPRRPHVPGTSRLLEVPVTIWPHRFGRVPVLGPRLRPRWLRPTWSSAARLVAVAQDEVARARRAHPSRPVILNAMFHNVEVVPRASPYAATERGARRILDRTAHLLRFARSEAMRVIGLADVPEVLG